MGINRIVRLLKQVVNEAAGKKHRMRSILPPHPSCGNRYFPGGVR